MQFKLLTRMLYKKKKKESTKCLMFICVICYVEIKTKKKKNYLLIMTKRKLLTDKVQINRN